jgi:hypothetical protein
MSPYIFNIPLYTQNDPSATTVKLEWARANDTFTPHIIIRHTEEPIEEGASIFCAEMFGNGVVRRVSRMRGSYVSLDAEFLNRTQSWTGLKHRTIIVPSHMIRLPWAQQIWLFFSILHRPFLTYVN